MEPQASQGQLGAEGGCGMLSLLLPSPQSEAVTHEMEELSLQPTQSLPPLNERKNVLQLRLQQRRTREQLVEQGIMPPLKSPAAFHGQIRSLERARTENFLKHKIRSRPERAELVRMHILQETGAEPSLQATQMRLKRARLADNLNEKIAQRPGPMELVEKNILPVDSTLKQAIIVGQVNYPKVLDEDSYDALSPEQPASQESQSSVPSPAESKVPETPSPAPAPPALPSPLLQAFPVVTQATTDFVKVISTNEPPTSRPAVTPAQPVTTAAPSKPGPTLIKQSQQKTPSEKSRSKKGKEPRPRVKKLKYHQYVPPDQKQEASEAPMDSSYARLLQQQQLFLQLQILSQQQQHYNYQTILPAPLKPVAEGQSSSTSSLPTSIMVSLPTAPPPPTVAPARSNNSLSNRKPGVLPANLEEMKVAELKLELKLRGLPVSGTKTDLIERLKPFQDNPSTSAPNTAPAPATTIVSSVPMEVNSTTTTPALVFPVQQVAAESMNPTPPVSPNPTDPSTHHQDVGMSETPETQTVSSGWAGQRSSPLLSFQVPEEKDRRLHEKERQIEELMRKLEQEQRLVEVLKMQLEVEKRASTSDSATVSPKLTSVPAMNPVPTVLSSNVVKMEGTVLSNCSSTTATIPNSILGSQTLSPLPTMVKLEDVTVSSGKPLQLQAQTQLITQIQPQAQSQVTTSPQLLSQSQRSPKLQTQPQSQPAAPSLQQFFISHTGGVSQVLGQPQTLLTTTGQAGTQILLPVSLPNNATAIQLPSTTVSLQPVLQATVSNPGLVQGSVPQLPTTKMETAPSQQLANHNQLLQTLTMCNNATGLENQTGPEMNPQCFLRSSPENRVSPRASPNHISNGPFNKPTFILQSTSLITQPPKTREPPRYEEAVKQSRNLHANHVSQVPTATSQQMDDLFDILIESGEITPFIQQDPSVSVTKTVPVTANITTLPVNTALSRPPPQIQLAPPPTLSPIIGHSLPTLSSLATDNQLEAFLEGTLADTTTATDPRTRGLMEELQAQLMDQQPYSPMDTSDLSFCDSSSPPSSLNMGLSDPGLDNMEWLDLTMPPGPAGALTPLGIPTDFLDTHDLQLHWD
ncbi:myocardin-related transcription factor B isoform X2 [Dicentrarchus labrax]|uniref:myocardin-related transcription factor B isoform X2 n=1 Tax=Dicentrarchus labrax TaxID=13489 RepID=UPI0021F55930|nr:myocardin-related transcription factor B isoform X2 [Dicentrarchus labrax]